jgi:hypothetical protein
VAIVALVLWVVTAAAGVSLLSAGGAARRRAAGTGRPLAGTGRPLAGTGRSPAEGTRAPAGTGTAAPGVVRTAGAPAAVPLAPGGKPPPGPHVKVATPPGEHPLLEFSHPALALTGLACWFMFVFVRYAPFAWISFGVLVATIGLGLSWLARNAQAARRRPGAAWKFPPQLVLLHGGVAAVAIALTVVTALSASHG